VQNFKKQMLAAALALALPTGISAAAAHAQVPGKAYDAPQTTLPASVQDHIDMAYLLADPRVSVRNAPGTMYVADDKVFQNPVPVFRKMPSQPATKAFDQFYFLGVNWVSAWALNTKDGIILFDTLNNPDEAKTYIEDGLRHVGLDPKNIKYIVLTHGHADHYGGAKYLQDKYHAHVLMSAIDWDAVAKAPPPAPGAAPAQAPPTHDMDIADGQKLTLGGTTISFYLTPGHTPGTISTIIPVTDHGVPHVISFIGGTGLTRPQERAHADVLRHSLEKFAKISIDAGADVVISSHPFLDDAWDKAKLVNETKPKVSPWVATKDAVLRYYASCVELVYAIEAFDRLKAAAKP
jgi:metallo-beta-lactamase class B